MPRMINTKKSTPRYIIFKLQETEEEIKILKEAKGKHTFSTEEQEYELHWTSHQKPCKQEES